MERWSLRPSTCAPRDSFWGCSPRPDYTSARAGPRCRSPTVWEGVESAQRTIDKSPPIHRWDQFAIWGGKVRGSGRLNLSSSLFTIHDLLFPEPFSRPFHGLPRLMQRFPSTEVLGWFQSSASRTLNLIDDSQFHRRHHEIKSLLQYLHRCSSVGLVRICFKCTRAGTNVSATARTRRLYQEPLHQARSHDSDARRREALRMRLRT